MRDFRRFSLIVFIAALTALPSALAAQPRIIEYTSERFVVVGGEGSVAATPDFARVTLGVTTAGKEAGEAMAANARSVSAVLAAIKAEGVAAADLQTTGLSVSPIYANPAPGQQGAPSITGYNVSNTVAVTIRDMSRLGPLLDKAIEAGANTMYGVAFGQNNLSALLDKARPLAVADARRKAEIFAKAGGAETRAADGIERRDRRSTVRSSRAGICPDGGVGPADADRGGRGQADGDDHRQIRADAVDLAARAREKRADALAIIM